MEQKMNFNQWYREVLDAVEHLDAVRAHTLLKSMSQAATLSVQGQVSMQNDLQRLEKELRRVALPDLPVEEAQDILENEVLGFFESETDLGERLSVRRAFLGYGLKEEDRQSLKKSILANKEKIGSLTLGEWLNNFDKMYPPQEREERAVIEYFQRNPKIASLDKNNQIILKKILEIYDRWLSAELLDLIDLGNMHQKIFSGLPLRKGGVSFEKHVQNKTDSKSITSLPLLQALSRYEQLGQQVITSEKIKLKTQIEPVRPSLVNWLKYYRDELGIGQHSSVERGEFLFRSENGRKLSGEERERISLILKSVEEYLPIAIDAERQEIIFPKFQVMSANFDRRPNVGLNTAGSPAFPSVAPNSQGRNTYFENPKPTPPISSATLGSPARSNAGSVSFSSGHTLPAEKEASGDKEAPRPTKPFQPSSFRIRPMTNKE